MGGDGKKDAGKLSGRTAFKEPDNVVLTRNAGYRAKDTVIVHDIPELLVELKKYPSDAVYVVGGGTVYEELLPYCDEA